MRLQKLPKGSRVFTQRPIVYESGYLYFEVSPWSHDEPVYLKVPSKGSLRAVQYWLNRIVDWDDTGMVTHIYGEAA